MKTNKKLFLFSILIIIYIILISNMMLAITFSNPTVNNTFPSIGDNVNISIKINDTTNIVSYSFSHYNGSEWFNDTTAFSSSLKHFAFDDGSGTNVINTGRLEGNGTASSSNIWTTDAKIGSYAINTTNDYVKASSNLTNQYVDTVAMWFKLTDTINGSSNYVELFMGSNSGYNDCLGTNPTSCVDIYFGPNWGGFNCNTGQLCAIPNGYRACGIKSTSTLWNANTWYHVAYTANTSHLCLYINGVLDLCSEKTGCNQNIEYYIVGGNYAGNNKFPGVIDDFFIYDKDLSANEINLLYINGEVSRKSINPVVISTMPNLSYYNYTWFATNDSGTTAQSDNYFLNINTPTYFSNNAVNNSLPNYGDIVMFNISINDDNGLKSYIFSYQNFSNWINVSFNLTFGVTNYNISIVQTILNQTGFDYTWYATDIINITTQSNYYHLNVNAPTIFSNPLVNNSFPRPSENVNFTITIQDDDNIVSYKFSRYINISWINSSYNVSTQPPDGYLDSLVQYNFDEGTGNVTRNAGRYTGYNGTLVGDRWLPGKYGTFGWNTTGTDITGTGDITGTSNISNSGIISLSMWIKSDRVIDVSWPANPDDEANLFSGETSAYDDCAGAGNPTSCIGIFFDWSNSGKLEFDINPYTNGKIISNQNAWNADQWYHIVAVSNSTFSWIYINGVLDNNVSHPLSTADIRYFSVGRWYRSNADINGKHFPGTIDNFNLFDRTLNATEVYQLYSYGSDILNLTSPSVIMIIPSQSIYNYTWYAIDTNNIESQSDYFNLTINAPMIFSNNIVNNTLPKYNQNVKFNITINDLNGVFGYVFTYYNGSDWLNDSFVSAANVSCYQEQTNISSITDGNCVLDYTGKYLITGTFLAGREGNYSIDGNYTTYSLPTTDGEIFMNYTKPKNVIGAIWQVDIYSGGGHNLVNRTIPDDCFNYDSQKLILKVESVTTARRPDCFNGTDWKILTPTYTGGGLAEEGIFWLLNYNEITVSAIKTMPLLSTYNYSWYGQNFLDTWFQSDLYYSNVTIYEIYVNSINLTTYTIYSDGADDIDCTFNISDLNPDILSNVSLSWFKNNLPIHTYDYNFTSITQNNIYTTDVGQGRVTENLVTGDVWKCNIFVNDSSVTLERNSSAVTILDAKPSVLIKISPVSDTKVSRINTTISWTESFRNSSISSICYQETANVTTSCGGLNTGIYAMDYGVYDITYDSSKMIDGNWTTYGRCRSPVANCGFFVNYTIPLYTAGAKLRVGVNSTAIPIEKNITIPQECLLSPSLQIAWSGRRELVWGYGNFDCIAQNGNAIRIYSVDASSSIYADVLWEEAIYWNFSEIQGKPNTPFNTTIILNSNTILTTVNNGTTSYLWNTSSFSEGSYNLTLFSCNIYGCGNNYTSSNITINSIPFLIVNTTPLTLYNNDTLLGWVFANDSNNDNQIYNYTWYINNQVNKTGVTTSLNSNILLNINNISSSNLHVYDNWTFSVQSFDGVDYSNWQNSTQNTVLNRVLRNLMIYVPPTTPNNTISNQYLFITYSIIDEDQGIVCNISVNESTYIQNVTSGINKTKTVDHLASGPQEPDGVYLWNISCISNGDVMPIISGNYNFELHTSPPIFSNPQTDESNIYPQIDDTFHMNITVFDDHTVDMCALALNDTGVWQNKTLIHLETNGLINFSYVIQPYSDATHNNIAWRVWCNDSINNVNVSDIYSFTVKDIAFPMITLSPDGNFVNNTILSNYFYNATFGVTIFDYNLFQFLINVTCDISGQIYYYQELNFTNTTFTKNDIINITNLPLQKCNFFVSASDDHTNKKIRPYEVETNNNNIVYRTSEALSIDITSVNINEADINSLINDRKNIINEGGKGTIIGGGKIEPPIEPLPDEDTTIDMPIDEQIQDITTTKTNDAYTFTFKYDETATTRSFKVHTDGILFVRDDDKYMGHLVAWNDATHSGNWIDFNVKDFNLTKDNYIITQIDEHNVIVEITSDVPIQDYKFTSIGGLNIENMTWDFYIGGILNISSINIYDNTSIQNFYMNVTTLNSTPGKNISLLFINNSCYQETATQSTNCGGLLSGKYGVEGNWTGNTSTLYDGDILSGCVKLNTTSQNATLYINYTLPPYTQGDTAWFIADNSTTVNYNIPSHCLVNPVRLRIITENKITGGMTDYFYCYNTTSSLWTLLNTLTSSTLNEEWLIWGMNPSNRIIDGFSNGTYQIDYSSSTFFDDINNILSFQDIVTQSVYSSYQSIINLIFRNIKSLAILPNVSITLINNASGKISNANSGIEGVARIYLNATNYSMYASGINYVPYNASFLAISRTNTTLIFDMFYYAYFNLYDEKSLGVFDISGTNSTKFLLFCPLGTFETIITNSTFAIPITCDYDKFKFIVDYGSLGSYYRSVLITPTEFLSDATRIYLMDLRTTSVITNTFIVEDLLKQYTDIKVYIMKTINNNTVQITADAVDIENKLTAYLILNNQYIVEIHSSNKPTKIIGNYNADFTGNKNLRLYEFTLNAQPADFSSTVILNPGSIDNSTGNKFVIASYNDSLGQTNSVTWTVRETSVDGLVLTTVTTTEQNATFSYAVPIALENTTLVSTMFINHTSGQYLAGGFVQIFDTAAPAITQARNEFLSVIGGGDIAKGQLMLNWFITILLGFIALTFTARTASVGAIVVCVMAAFFVFFKLYTIGWGLLIIAALIALGAMLKEKGEEA